MSKNSIEKVIREMDDYVPIMYGVLPKNVKGSDSWENYNEDKTSCPKEISNHFRQLSEYIGVDSVVVRYSEILNGFVILADVDANERLNYVDKAIEFELSKTDSEKVFSCFCPVSSTKYKPEVVDIVARESMTQENFKSYFEQSLFHDLIRYPCGDNIIPHNDDFDKKYGQSGGGSYLNVTDGEVIEDGSIMFSGKFAEVFEKGGCVDCFCRYSLEDCKLSFKSVREEEYDFLMEYLEENQGCIVNDYGDFETKILFGDDKITLVTSANAKRQVAFGPDLEGQGYLDKFFTGLSEDGIESQTTCVEHFVRIGDGSRLLHYSEDWDSFEIFELPEKWVPRFGISHELVGYPKVFDADDKYCTIDDFQDKDLDEILGILNSREKCNISGHQLTKRDIK